MRPSCFGPSSQQVVIDPGSSITERARGPARRRPRARHCRDRTGCAARRRRGPSTGSRRSSPRARPRVTGSTRCRLDDGIEHHMPGGQLDRLRAELVLDQQLAAVVGCRDPRGTASPTGRCARGTRCRAGCAPRCRHGCRTPRRPIAVEQRREDLERQRRGDEQRRAAERLEHHRARLARRRAVLGAAARCAWRAPTGGPR